MKALVRRVEVAFSVLNPSCLFHHSFRPYQICSSPSFNQHFHFLLVCAHTLNSPHFTFYSSTVLCSVAGDFYFIIAQTSEKNFSSSRACKSNHKDFYLKIFLFSCWFLFFCKQTSYIVKTHLKFSTQTKILDIFIHSGRWPSLSFQHH